ncbi:MAG: excinuclease ABC subunit UvrA [Anaerolineae bacterium]|nr:excinuclease ABC subunit UvrA [Anaerolineae bacterium]NIN93700.1 excinuclease ABC subunit UvrA [Anaerolineae bacterium]NIQ76747.1 excinuclease ABC subunit UvrA [Anaerolineae bacterium]
MPQDKIVVHGAREHNLKNIDVEIPRDKFVVITGISGSGKSSLAFDTIYAEGQRRYVESLSAYARQFLGQMDKPSVDQIEGLSPAVSIDQRGVSHNPRSTVGTVTEIYDYLRLLFARIGIPHCPHCGRVITQQSAEQIVDSILELAPGTRIVILAPLVKDRKGHHQRIFEDVRKAGYVRVRVNGELRDVDEEIELERYKKHTIEAVVDRLIVPESPEELESFRSRLNDSVETALPLGDGVVIVTDVTSEPPRDLLFSEHFACAHCGVSLGEIEPRTFSFNSPHGACPTCQGIGTKMEIDPDLVIPDKSLSLSQGALDPWSRRTTSESYFSQLIKAVADHHGFSTEVPVRELTAEHIDILLYGNHGEDITLRYRNHRGKIQRYTTTYEGVIPNLERRYRETNSDYIRSEIEQYMSTHPCPSCGGKRLKPESLAVTVAGNSIDQVTAMSVSQALKFFEDAPKELSDRELAIGERILKEIRERLGFMVNVGLDYLTLDRSATTLAGGEAQRLRLATQIGSQLMGVLYILDEPSIGLHQRDNKRLINTLMQMRDLGNTLLVVEHDEETMRSADYIIDLGPGAGDHGGYVVAAGSIEDIIAVPGSITGQYLSGKRSIPVPDTRRSGNGESLVIQGAAEHNLKEIDVTIPLGKFICITGVSGSGKSTLLVEVLYRRLAMMLHRAKAKAGRHKDVLGVEHLDKVINIDQSPIGRTPRSNPGTYTNVFTYVRELFASLPEAKIRGYKPGRFSFNVKGGRCEACQGDGIIKIEMHFLPDIHVPCEVCKGKRFNRETLQVRYKGQSIADVLDMTVEECMEFFDKIPRIKRKLKTLWDVGLGYIKLGQSSTTLSGGEAQRIKLSRELSKRATGQTLYILDEPTTGLHFEDIQRLLDVLNRLVDAGNTVVVIEHNLDVIKCADWIIDLGPEGGEEGGYVIAEGTPEEITRMPHSYTGHFLKRVLDGHRS